MKPSIVFVDDDSHNLTVFEVAMPEDWDVYTFDNPLKAMEKISQISPWVVLSDQRMPSMSGVNFLEIVKKLNPYAVRALVTGFSEEDLVVESVRKAHIFDYIRKPWDVDDLVHRVGIMVETYRLEAELKEKNQQLTHRNKELELLNQELAKSKEMEEQLRQELEAWAPPFMVSTLKNSNDFKFPKKKDLAIIACDIVDSSRLHGVFYHGKPLRTHIMNTFSECVMKQGGWHESTAGDAAYAHFGFVTQLAKPADAAFAAASEFRVQIRNLSVSVGMEVECGIALHIAPDCLIDIHEIKAQIFGQEVVHKTFETNSFHVDLVHRMEKLMHKLSGSNIVLSQDFFDRLSVKPEESLFPIGDHLFKGQNQPISLFVKLSSKHKPEELQAIVQMAVNSGASSLLKKVD